MRGGRRPSIFDAEHSAILRVTWAPASSTGILRRGAPVCRPERDYVRGWACGATQQGDQEAGDIGPAAGPDVSDQTFPIAPPDIAEAGEHAVLTLPDKAARPWQPFQSEFARGRQKTRRWPAMPACWPPARNTTSSGRSRRRSPRPDQVFRT